MNAINIQGKPTQKNAPVPVNNHILDMITPSAIEFSQTFVNFGEYCTKTYVVTGYPPRVKFGWLSKIANIEGVICSIHCEPTEPAGLLKNVSDSMKELTAKLNQPMNQLARMRTERQYYDAEHLIKMIDEEQQSVFFVTTLLFVYASDKEALLKKCKKIEGILAGSSLRARAPMFRQEDALKAVGPFCMLPQTIKDLGSRNMPSSTLAAAFPYSSASLNDGKGFVLGLDSSGGIIILDMQMRGDDRTNSNSVTMGVPGVGKSTTVKHILINRWGLGSKIIIIDPEREYKDLCENLGGQWINCGGGVGGRINPLQVKEAPKDENDEEIPLYKDTGKGIGPLALHFQTLRTFFKLYFRSVDEIDIALLEETLEELYREWGITWDTDTSKLSNDQYPLMDDLYKMVQNKVTDDSLTAMRRERFDKLSTLLRRIAVGADAALFNGHTTIAANSDFIVLDTHELQDASDNIKRTQYFNILTWCWNQIERDREEVVDLAIDEAYLIVDNEVPEALQFVRNVNKRIRKYEGGLHVISHSVVDFNDESVKRYGQAIIDNSCFKFLMGTDAKNLQETAEMLKLTEMEMELLAKKKRKHALLMAGSKRVHAIIEVPDFELELFGKGGGR